MRGFLELGGAMGWRPHEVRACSISDFQACFDGWNKARGAGEDAMPQSEIDELKGLLDG